MIHGKLLLDWWDIVRNMETIIHTKERGGGRDDPGVGGGGGRPTASPVSACLTRGMKISERWLG
jgi:hypothetical protein